jgi:hypothetical protein
MVADTNFTVVITLELVYNSFTLPDIFPFKRFGEPANEHYR